MEKKLKLSPEALEAKRRYQNSWRRRNPDKIAQYTCNYWEKVAKRLKESEQ